MRLNHLMSLLEMENSIFKDIVLCYAELRSSATLLGHWALFSSQWELNTGSLAGKWRVRLVEPCSVFPETEMGTAAGKSQGQGDPVSFFGQAEGRSLKEGCELRPVRARGSWQTFLLPTSPSQIPLYNRYEALGVEWPHGPCEWRATGTEVLPRSERTTPPQLPHITPTSTRKRRWVIVVDDSLLRGTDPPLHHAHWHFTMPGSISDISR